MHSKQQIDKNVRFCKHGYWYHATLYTEVIKLNLLICFTKKKIYIIGYVKKKTDRIKIISLFDRKEERDLVLKSKDIPEEYVLLIEVSSRISVNRAKIVKIIGKRNRLLSIKIIKHLFNTKKTNTSYKNRIRLEKKYKYKQKDKRLNVKDLPFFTVDGYCSKDFDDAVYVKKRRDDSYLLLVCISDVNYYVKNNSYLDKKALESSFSIYLPHRSMPMFPYFLSSRLCSIRPNETRLSFMFEIIMSATGKLYKYEIHKVLMNSKIDFSYAELNNILFCEKSSVKKSYPNLLYLVRDLCFFYDKRSCAIKEKVMFPNRELNLKFNRQGKLEIIRTGTAKLANILVEQVMIATNFTSSKFIRKSIGFSVYRNHRPPSKKNSILLNKFNIFIEISSKKYVKKFFTIKYYTKIMETIKLKPLFYVYENLLLNSFEKAVYEAEVKGHFGLNYCSYTHITSPIRRYSDFITYKILDYYVFKNDKKYNYSFLDKVSSTLNLNELKIDRIVSKIKFSYLRIKLNSNPSDTYNAIIIHINKFGFFIKIGSLNLYGLVNNDCLIKRGNNNIKSTYFVGDVIKVKLHYVDTKYELLNFYIRN